MSRKKTNKIEAETGEVVQSNRPFIIRNGGIAKPLGQGLYLLGGKTHEQGGIDIDFTGDARIFSAQPILNGNSPAELVVRGANPNITFNRQERFKDVNRINDDGSRKAKCGKRVKAEIGTETKQGVPTREEYITSKIDSTINAALNKSRTRKEGIVPILDTIDNSDPNIRKKNVESALNRAETFQREALLEADMGNMDIAKRYRQYAINEYELAEKQLTNCSIDTIYGPGCIYTATDNYGKQYRVSGNQTFAANPNKYGFIKINTKDRQPGDLQQHVSFRPIHMMLFNGYDENGKPRYNYSSGEPMKVNANYPIDEKNGDRIDSYRFVGTPADSVRWTNEYNKLYMNNSNKKRLGGSTGLIRVQANGKDRLMYVPFTGEETKASRKKAEFGDEVIITAPNKKREETLDDYFPKIADSITYPDSLYIVSPYIRTPYSIRTKTPADLERDMKVQMIGREFSNDTTSNHLDKVRFNEAYVPYDGEMATVTPSTSVVPNSIENPIERINRGWQSEYKPVVTNNTIKEVNGVINTSWLPKRDAISINIPKINTHDPRIAMIGRTFTDDKKVSQPNKVNIPKFTTPTITGVSSSLTNLPSEITLSQNVQNAINRNIATNGYNEFMGYNKYNVPEITKKQERQQTREALKKEGLDWVSRNKNWAAPAISALSNGLAGLLSYRINKNMLGDMKYADKPIPKRANPLITRVDVEPKLTNLRENLARSIENITANASSSRVSQSRINDMALNTTLAMNAIYADKENQERDLINKSRLNQQEVANANIDAYNTWRTGKTNFENAIREQMSENAVSLVDNINKGIQTGITDAEKRRQFRNNLAIMAAAYPNVTPELLRTYGADFLRMGGKVKLNKKK